MNDPVRQPSCTRYLVQLFAHNVTALEHSRPLTNLVDRTLGYHPLAG